MTYDSGAVHFPVSWVKPDEIETTWMGERGPIYPNLPPETVVKMHWRKSRFTVTYADGSRYCQIKDLELFYEEET